MSTSYDFFESRTSILFLVQMKFYQVHKPHLFKCTFIEYGVDYKWIHQGLLHSVASFQGFAKRTWQGGLLSGDIGNLEWMIPLTFQKLHHFLRCTTRTLAIFLMRVPCRVLARMQQCLACELHDLQWLSNPGTSSILFALLLAL